VPWHRVHRRRRQRGWPIAAAADYAYSGDAAFLDKLAALKPVTAVVEAAVRFWQDVERHELLGSAVRVSAEQFPGLHGLVLRCAVELDITEPEVYVTQRIGSLNASTYGTNQESCIVVNSAMVDHFSDDELLFVLGHECGHIQNSHVVYQTAAHLLTRLAGGVAAWAVAPASLALIKWSRSCEITSDRAGLLCCGDIEVATRVIVKMALGSQKLYEEVDVEAYLRQADDAPAGLARFRELFKTHPHLPKRIEALRLFARSAVYRAAVDEGTTGLSRITLDERVRNQLKIW
jgi:Zn-dependent protease with chaperone function